MNNVTGRILIMLVLFVLSALRVPLAWGQVELDIQRFFLNESVDDCATAVSGALRAVDGIHSVSADRPEGLNSLSLSDYFPEETRLISADAGPHTLRAECIGLPDGMTLLTLTLAGTDVRMSGLARDFTFALDAILYARRQANTPAPTGSSCNISGTFDTGESGPLTITRNGNRISVSYQDGQGTANGTLTETPGGLVAEGSFANRRYDTRGTFNWRFSADGSSFSGRWTNEPSGSSGDWSGHCVADE